MADTIGTDIACSTDIGPRQALIGGNLNLANAIVRRLSTQYGALAAIDPQAADYGLDLRAMVGGPPPPLGFWEAAIRNEVEKDERIVSAVPTVTFSAQTSTATVSITVTPSSGPTFPLVLSVSSLTVTLLNQGAPQ